MSVSLSTLEATWAGGSVKLTQSASPVRIGRFSYCGIRIIDPMISGHQGTLCFVDGNWRYEDTISTNGTWLRGGRVAHIVIAGETALALGGSEGPTLHLRPVRDVHTPLLPPISSGNVDGTTSQWRRRERSQGVLKSFTVGRSTDADHPVADMLASRSHARLELLEDGSARIVDLNSVNGTYVDGVAASPSLAVLAGQRVSIGNTTFTFDGARLVPSPLIVETVFTVDALTTTVDTKLGPKELLSNVRFALQRGSLMAVLGPSGAGKSTLLGAITGTRPATSGVVRFSGLDLYRNYGEVRHRIGFVPQEDILHPLLTTRTALRHAARLRFPADTTQAERDARINVVLGQLHLTEHAEKQIANLSGGQRGFLVLARALASPSKLLFLDEPTGAMDMRTEATFVERLKTAIYPGQTLVISTHRHAVLSLCDRLIVMDRGKIVADGPRDQIMQQAMDKTVDRGTVA